ncbi:hypothetical protein KPL70_007535 [Citrus sinensis]|nr:hypothetical protein KPL70_007535 [Citrus sinensis]
MAFTSSSTPSNPVTLSSTLSLPKSCTSHTANKIENLVEYSYIPESAQISESSYPLISPYQLYKCPSSFTRSIHTLISTRRPQSKEYIQSSCLDQCAFQATSAEQYVTLEITSELISNWKREGYTHLHLGGIRLILTLHGRKGLPVTARLAMLDTRFKQYQDAVIGTVLTTFHAGSVLLTFYPNFNLSLQDINLPTTLKVQVQIQGDNDSRGFRFGYGGWSGDHEEAATANYSLLIYQKSQVLLLFSMSNSLETLMQSLKLHDETISGSHDEHRQLLTMFSTLELIFNKVSFCALAFWVCQLRTDSKGLGVVVSALGGWDEDPGSFMDGCGNCRRYLDFHYKRMSLLFYKLNGFNEPTLKHVFLASLPDELQLDIQQQLTASNLSLDNISLGKIFQLAKTCLDKLCEQKQFFKELLKDKKPFRSACKKPYLHIKCQKKKDCDCSSKKKRHFRKFKNPDHSSRPRKSRKPYRFFRKKSSSSRDFKRRKSSRCFICKKKGHYAKDCPNKLEKSIRLVEHLQATTNYSLENDELEFYFSEQDEPNDETVFVLQNSSDDSDSDQSQVIFHQQLLSLDTSIPIPSIKLQILPSKFQRPIPAIGLIDTGAQRSMLNPHILPPEYWTVN